MNLLATVRTEPKEDEIMTEHDRPSQGNDAQGGEALRGDMQAIFRKKVAIPAELDAAILAMARHELRRRHGRWRLWGGVGVAAAVLLAGTYMTLHKDTPVTSPQQFAASTDPGHDILDAFLLARKLKSGSAVSLTWDVTHDGHVDDQDVQWLAAQAVSLKRRTL